MSNDALNWAWKAKVGRAKLTLVCLADQGSEHSGEDWTCFPSVAFLVARTDQNASTIERHLKQLWREGWLSRKRRRRADGRLGIYDFILHREPEYRDALKAQRAAAPQGGELDDQGDEPPGKMPDGPAGDLAGATRQNEPQPPGKLPGQEPLGEPLEEPLLRARAREPGDHGFEAAAALWPESGRKRTRWPQARAAWAWACQTWTAEQLAAAIIACGFDPDMAKGDHGWPALDRWLSEERFRAWLPKAAEAADAAPAGPPPFDGPAEVEAAIAHLSPTAAWASARLAGAVWLGDERSIRPFSGWAYRELTDRLRRHLPNLEFTILDPRA